MKHAGRFVAVAAITIAWAGCGGTTDGGSKHGTGLPDDLVLDDASATQLRQVCDYYLRTAVTQDVEEGICAVGVDQSLSALECSHEVAACAADIDASISSGATARDCVAAFQSGTCASTVAEMEKCIGDLKTYLQTVYGGIDCSTTDAELLDLAAVDQPDSCNALEAECPAFFGGTQADCCSPDDPCGWGDDLFCDCPEQAWDAADCSGNPCCTTDDACGYANDGYCDCPDQAWDATDCSGSSDPCCTATDACLFADDGYCDCPEQRWDRADCSTTCCGATDVCTWGNDGVCECPSDAWDVTDCTAAMSDAGSNVTDAGGNATDASSDASDGG